MLPGAEGVWTSLDDPSIPLPGLKDPPLYLKASGLHKPTQKWPMQDVT